MPAFQIDLEHGLEPLSKPRLGIVRFEKWSRAEPEQQRVFDAAIEKLRASGAVLEELVLAELDRVNWQAILTILESEGAHLFADLVARYPDRTSDHLKSLVANGNAISAPDYLAAKALQEQRRLALGTEMRGFDALLTLPAFGEAPRGLCLYRRRRILRAMDFRWRTRGDAAGRVRQERLTARHSDRRRA